MYVISHDYKGVNAIFTSVIKHNAIGDDLCNLIFSQVTLAKPTV